jgi:hypothetical protein
MVVVDEEFMIGIRMANQHTHLSTLKREPFLVYVVTRDLHTRLRTADGAVG